MLKKIFKIILCIIAIWITIVAEEESGAPNTLITENPEKEVTTVESLPTRDRAKLSLTVNKIVPKEIMGIYKDGVLEVYLEGKNAAAQPQTMLRSMNASTSTPSTSIANRKLKAYSKNSGAEKIKTMSRFRSNISLEEAFKNAEPNEEKTVEVVEEDGNGTRLAIQNVAEGEEVYLSVMSGDNIVETYSIGGVTTFAVSNETCWPSSYSLLVTNITKNSTAIATTTTPWIDYETNIQIANNDGGINNFRLNKEPKAGDQLNFKDEFFNANRIIQVSGPKADGCGFRLLVKAANSDTGTNVYINDGKDWNGNSLPSNFIKAYPNNNVYFGNNTINTFRELNKIGEDRIPDCSADKAPNERTLLSPVVLGFNFGLVLSNGNYIPGLYKYDNAMKVDINLKGGGTKTVTANYIIDVGESKAKTVDIDLYSISEKNIIDHSKDTVNGLSFMTKSGSMTFANGTFEAGIWYNGTQHLNENPTFTVNATSGSGTIQVTVKQDMEGYAKLEVTPQNVTHGSNFDFTLVQGRKIGETLRKIREVTYNLTFPQTSKLGDVTFNVDSRIRSVTAGDWINGKGQLKNNTGNLINTYPELIQATDTINNTSTNVSSVKNINGKSPEFLGNDSSKKYTYLNDEGNNKFALPYDVNIGVYDVENANTKMVISKADLTGVTIGTEPITVRNTFTVQGSDNNYYTGSVTENYVVTRDNLNGSGTIDMSNATVNAEYVFLPGVGNTQTGTTNTNGAKTVSLIMDSGSKSPDGRGVLSTNNTDNIVNQIELSNGTENQTLTSSSNGRFDPQNITIGGLDNKFAIGFDTNGGLILKKTGNANFGEDTKNVTIKYKYNGVLLGTFSLGIKSSRTEKDLGILNVDIDSRMKQLSNRWVFIGSRDTSSAIDNISKVGSYSDFIETSSAFSNFSNLNDTDKQSIIKNVESINSSSSLIDVGDYKRTSGDPSTSNNSVAIPYKKEGNLELTVGEFISINDNSMLVIEKNNDMNGENNFTLVASSPDGAEVAFSGNIHENYRTKTNNNITIEGSTIKDGAVTGKISIDLAKANIGQTYEFAAGSGTMSDLDVILSAGSNLDTTSAITGKTGNKANFIAIKVGNESWVNVPKTNLEYDILNGAVTIGVNDNGGLSITKNHDVNIEETKIILEAWYLPNDVSSAADETSKAKSIQLSVVEVTISNVQKTFNNVTIHMDKRLEQVTAGSWIKFSDKKIHSHIANSIGAGVASYEDFISIPTDESFTDEIVDGYMVSNVLEINNITSLSDGYYYKFMSGSNEMVIPSPARSLSLNDFIKLDETSLHAVSKNDIGDDAVENTFKILTTKENSPSIVYSGKIIENYVAKANGASTTTNENGATTQKGAVAGKANIILTQAQKGGVYKFAPNSATDITSSDGKVTLNMTSGHSLDATSALSSVTGNIANALVIKEPNKAEWSEITFDDYKSQDISTNILDNKVKIGVSGEGGLLISKLTDEDITLSKVILEVWYIPTGCKSNDGKSIQLSTLVLNISNLKSDLGTMSVKLDDRLAQINNNSWIDLGRKSLKNVSGVELGNYSDFINVGSFNITGNGYNGNDIIESIESINGIKTFVNLGNDTNYKKVDGNNEGAIPFQKDGNTPLSMSEFINIGTGSKLLVSRWDLTKSDHDGRNEFVLYATRNNGGVVEKVRYTGNIQEQYIGNDGSIRYNISDKSTTYTTGQGSINLIGLENGEYSFPTSVTENKIIVDNAEINVSNGNALDATGRVASENISLATNVRLTINNQTYSTSGEKGQKITKNLSTEASIPLSIGVSVNGGLVIEKLNDNHIPETTIKVEAFYSPDKSLGSGKDIKLGEFTITVKNIVGNLGKTEFTVDRRIGELISEGEWLSTDGTLKNSQGTAVGVFPELVDVVPTSIDLTTVGTTIVTDVLAINGANPTDHTGAAGKPNYGYWVDGNKKVALPYGNGVTLNSYDAEVTGNLLLVSTRDLAVGETTGELETNLEINNTYTVRTAEQRYTGILTENYIGNGVYQGSGTIVFDDEDKEVTYTFPTSSLEGTVTVTTNGKTLTMAEFSGSLPNGTSALAENQNIADYIEVVKNNQITSGANGATTVTVDNITFGIDNDGGLTINRGNSAEIEEEVIYTIKFYCKSENSYDTKVLLSTFDLTLKPNITLIGTIKAEVDIRAKQLANTYEWLAADGSLYNGAGVELGNYPELVNTTYTPLEGETLVSTNKVTAVTKIKDGSVEERTIGNYKYGVPQNQTTTSSNKVALPYSGASEVTLADYIQTTNTSSKFVVSTKNLSDTTSPDLQANFVIGTEDGRKYEGNLNEISVNSSTDSGNVPLNGYEGSGSVDLTPLMIGKEYKYVPGEKGGSINPTTSGTDGVINNTGTMVDARGILDKNKNENIATKVLITEEGTNETQMLTFARTRSANPGVTPEPITVGGIDGSIALGISSEGGLIIKKLNEEKIESVVVILKYIYDPANGSTTESGIVLGTYTLTITNNVEDIGNFTTKVDPRVLQQRTDNETFWIYSDGNISNDLGSQASNVSSLIAIDDGLNQNISFNTNSGITYIGDGILSSESTVSGEFKKFEENSKEILGIKNSVNSTNSLKDNIAFATYSSDTDNSYSIPIVVNGDTSSKYKLGAVLEYVNDDDGRTIPVDGYTGSGTLKLERAEKEVLYSFDPKGTTASNNGITLSIVEEAGENTMLDASDKVGNNGNIANLMKVTVDNGTPQIVEKNGEPFVYKVIQTNSSSLAGNGEVEVGITSEGGLSVKKVTNGNFNKRVKIEYLYKFDQTGGTTAEIKLGEVTLHIINEVIDLGTVVYRLDGRYYDGVLKKENKNTWLYPNGDATNGLKINQEPQKINYGTDKMFTYSPNGYTGTSDATIANIIEIVGRNEKMESNYEATINNIAIRFEAYKPLPTGWEDEMAIPIQKVGGQKIALSDLDDYFLGAFLNSGDSEMYDNIYYIMGSDGKIYVGNIKEEIAGNIGALNGTGKIDITEIEIDKPYIFEVNSQSGSEIVSNDGGLIMEYSGNLLNGLGRVGVNNGKTVANRIKITNIRQGGESATGETIVGEATTIVKNLEVGIDQESGGLTIKKITGDGIPENTGGFKFDIEYYYDPTVTTESTGTATTLGEGSVKLGTFSLDVIDYYVEIEGSNKLEFGNMIYQVTTDPAGVQRRREYFKVKNLGGKKLSFSVKSQDHGMLHEGNVTDPRTGEVGEIPLRVVVTDHIYQDQFKVEAEAYLTDTTPSGNYKGTIEVTVTIMDIEEGE